MADPVFDEEIIIQMLGTVPGPQQSVPILQQACTMAMMDLYDRAVDRDYFAKHAIICLTTYAMLSRTWMLMSMHDLYVSGNLTERSFTEAHDGITKLVLENAEKMIAMMGELRQCPLSTDPIS